MNMSNASSRSSQPAMSRAGAALLVLLTCSSLTPLTHSASLSSGGGQTLKPAPKGFTAPPEKLAPTPPGAPMLPQRNVGVISSADDVCKVCTRRAYSAECYSDFNLDCMSAIKQYFTNVLGVAETYCDCYTAVYNQLRVMCPSVDKMLKYSFTCDRYCYYGTKCPVNTVLYAVLKPGYMDLANKVTADIVGYKSPAAVMGQAAMMMELRISNKGASKLCYTLQADRFLPRPLSSATLRFGFLGQAGLRVQTLFEGNTDSSWAQRSACLPSSAATLLSVAGNLGRFYVAMGTGQGGVRGQLLPSVSLVARATAQNAGVPCSKDKKNTTCEAFVGLSATSTSVSYAIEYLPNPLPKVQAANIVRLVTRKVGPTTGWPPLMSFFSPGLGVPSTANTVSKDLKTVLLLLSGTHLVNITSDEYPRGALLGRIQDSLTVQTTLTGDQVLAGSKMREKASFTGQVGAGGICYTFNVGKAQLTRAFAYVHHAPKGMAGPYVVPNSFYVVNGRRICMRVDPTITGNIMNSPDEYYVQVYMGQNTPVLRGQLGVSPVQAII